MFKKTVLLTIAVVSALSLPVQAAKNDQITMLVMPRETIPLQIAQDISRRYPVLIVSYQMVLGNLKIHAWNGDEWVSVSVADYTNGTFFAHRPEHAVVVENARLRAPDVMIPNSLWCTGANRLTSTDPRTLIHLLGLYFDFPCRYWDQFAKRYGYSLEQVNPSMKNVHWWNLRGDIFLEKRTQRDFSVDLDKWQRLETLPPPAVAPVVAAETKQPAAPAKADAEATAVDITAKAPEAPVEKALAIVIPAPVVEPVKTAEPAPAAKPAPAAELVKPVEPAVPAPIAEPAPVAEPVATEETPAPKVVAEKTAVTPAPAPMAEPAATVDVDPFSADEIPAAEIVVPQEPKKRWWNVF